MKNEAAKGYVLITVALTSFSALFMTSSINIALPTIGENLEMDAIH
jgi:ribose/xylose/arabinose/galactoside ABC-type transport system permease subunit